MSTTIAHIEKRKMLVPKLRFKEFSSDWKKKNLGTIAELTSSKRVYLSDYVDKGIPFYRGKEISELKKNIVPNDILYITESSYLEFKEKYGIPQKNDILITAVGTLGNVLRIQNDDKFYFKDGNLIWFRKITESSEFLEIILEVKKLDIEKTSIGSTQRALTMVELRKLIFPFPTLPEQRKIASFLSAIDEKIQQLTRKKELLEQYKKGVMQQLFSGKLRFKDENGKAFPKWEDKRLGDVGDTFNGLTGKTKENFGEGKPYIQYMQIFSSSKIDVTKCGLVQILDNENQPRVQYGDVFFTTSSETPNEIGTCSVLLEETEEMYLNSFCFGFRPNSLAQLVPSFASYLFRNVIFRKKIIKLAQGSTRYNMSKVQLLKLRVSLPSNKEQKKIANYLFNIDNKIEIVNKQITQTQTFKKGLLQQMFV